MAKPIKAKVNSPTRKKALLVMLLFSVLSVFSIIMAIYDFAISKYIFGALFTIAALIFVMLILLKFNAIFGTYIKVKDNSLFMKSWVNDFLPYEVNSGFLSDLKPSKTKLTEIPIEELSLVLVGTKDFIKRNATPVGKKLLRALFPYEHSASKTKRELISSMDIMYIETIDGECSYMCIYEYDPKSVVDVIGELYEINPDLYIKVGSHDYRKYIKQLQSEFEEN